MYVTIHPPNPRTRSTSRLPNLQLLDLSRNRLQGPPPAGWSSHLLRYLYLQGNPGLAARHALPAAWAAAFPALMVADVSPPPSADPHVHVPREWLRGFCARQGTFVCLGSSSSGGNSSGTSGSGSSSTDVHGCGSYLKGTTHTHWDALNLCDHPGQLFPVLAAWTGLAAVLAALLLHHRSWLRRQAAGGGAAQQGVADGGTDGGWGWLVGPEVATPQQSTGGGGAAAAVLNGAAAAADGDGENGGGGSWARWAWTSPFAALAGGSRNGKSAADRDSEGGAAAPAPFSPFAQPAGASRGYGGGRGRARLPAAAAEANSNDLLLPLLPGADSPGGAVGGLANFGSGALDSGMLPSALSFQTPPRWGAGAAAVAKATISRARLAVTPGRRGGSAAESSDGGSAALQPTAVAAAAAAAEAAANSGVARPTSPQPLSFLDPAGPIVVAGLDALFNARLIALWGLTPAGPDFWPSYLLLALVLLPHVAAAAVELLSATAAAVAVPAALRAESNAAPLERLVAGLVGWVTGAPWWAAYPGVALLLAPCLVLFR
jgi:hypothetical protein